MRTSPAATSVFGDAGESGEARNFAKKLDWSWEVLHNLASLLLTNQTKRRGADL